MSACHTPLWGKAEETHGECKEEGSGGSASPLTGLVWFPSGRPAHWQADDSGLLVHCISGWDRTPLFISLLRLSLWAVSMAGLGPAGGSPWAAAKLHPKAKC